MAWDEVLKEKNRKGMLNICLGSLTRKNSNMISEIINLLVDILLVRVIPKILFYFFCFWLLLDMFLYAGQEVCWRGQRM